jgi:hypothetical protein
MTRKRKKEEPVLALLLQRSMHLCASLKSFSVMHLESRSTDNTQKLQQQQQEQQFLCV